MKLERAFMTQAGEVETWERITTFLLRAGYKQASLQPPWVYQRGSRWGSLLSFSPRGWKANVTIHLSPASNGATQVGVVLDVDTTGQWVTEKERLFWRSELGDLQASVCESNLDMTASADLARSSFWENIGGWAVTIALVIVLGLVGYALFASWIAGFVGGMLGLAIGILFIKGWLKAKIGGL